MLDGVLYFYLLNFCWGNCFFVLNFGSWFCFVFRVRIKEFLEIVYQFYDVVDFFIVYIEEVYFLNGWVFEVRVIFIKF